MPLIGTKNLGGNTRRLRFAVVPATFTASAGSESVNIGSALPATAVVLSVTVDLVTDFTDAGSITDLGLEIGSAADPNSFFTTLETMNDTPDNKRYEQKGVWEAGGGLQVQVKAIANSGNLGTGSATNLDAGCALVDVIYTYG